MHRILRTIIFGIPKLRLMFLAICNWCAVILSQTSGTNSRATDGRPDRSRSHIIPVSLYFFNKSSADFTDWRRQVTKDIRLVETYDFDHKFGYLSCIFPVPIKQLYQFTWFLIVSVTLLTCTTSSLKKYIPIPFI